jgi:hypothetical protein
MGCANSDDAAAKSEGSKSAPKGNSSAAAENQGAPSQQPGPGDMAEAKVLYVKLKAKWDSGKEGCPTKIEDLRSGLGDGGLTKPWSGMTGLRHKYFGFDKNEDLVCGVYAFYSQAALDKYMAGELFASHGQMPHFSSVEAEVHDVLVGTENSIENFSWKNVPPTREDVTAGAMLVVRLDIDLGVLAGAFGLPEGASKEEQEGAFRMNFDSKGNNYPGASFGKESGPKGLRGKYFTWNSEKNVCSGFYTFITKADLDAYMASKLFKEQADAPFISLQSATVYEILPGTEITVDQGSWSGK